MNTNQHPHSALRTGHGGAVPGRGKGDKVNAKYEPGEFVVSNDMLDAAPGLAEQLHDLRGEVLAKKGMTTAQADAKATAHSELRAMNGITPDKARIMKDRLAQQTAQAQAQAQPQAQPQAPIDKTTYRNPNTSGAGGMSQDAMDWQKASKIQPPTPGAGASYATGAAPRSAPPLSGAAPQQSTLSKNIGKVVGTSEEWSKYGGGLYDKASKVASSVWKPIESVVGGIAKRAPVIGAAISGVEGANAYKNGDNSGMAWAALDGAASLALPSPLGPTVAAPYLAGRALWETGSAINDYRKNKSVEMPKVEALQRPSQAAPGVPAPLPTPTQDANPYADKNAAMMAAANAANPDLRGVNTQTPADVAHLYERNPALAAKMAQEAKAATAPATNDVTMRDGSTMARAKWDEINAPGELGASRNHGNDGQLLDPSQEQVYTGDKLGWQTRTSEHGLQLRENKAAEHQALQDKNYAEATRGGGVFQRQLQSMRDEKDADYLNNVRQNAEFGNVKAKAEYEKLTAAKALRDDTRATRENASLVSRQAEERLNQTARRDENTLRRNERAEVFKTAVEGRKAEVDGRRLKLDEENALQAKSKEGFTQRQTELEKQFPDDPVGQKEFMQFSDNYRKEAARAVEKTDPERAKKILNQDHVLEADDRAKIQDAWDLRAATKKHAGKWYGSGKDTDSLNPADYAVTGVDDSNVFGGGKVTLRNGSNVPINDLNDQGWFGGPGSSRFVPMIKKAREKQAELAAQKAAQAAAR